MQYFDAREGAALRAAFDDLVGTWDGVEATTMFGCPSYRADGTLFVVLTTGHVALTQLPDADRERLAGSFEMGPFRAGDWRVTKWVQVSVDEASLGALEPYLKASYRDSRGKPTTSVV
jgi:hypothetical protein